MREIPSFTFLFKDTDWYAKVLMGGIILLTIPLGVGIILTAGYLVSLIRLHLSGSSEILPDWFSYRPIVVDGFRITLLAFIYLVPFLLLISFFPTIISFGILFLVILFLSPALMFQYCRTDSFKASFKIFEIAALIIRLAPNALTMLGRSTLFILTSVLFGWMFIIVGWPLLVFWSILVHTKMISELITLSRHAE